MQFEALMGTLAEYAQPLWAEEWYFAAPSPFHAAAVSRWAAGTMSDSSCSRWASQGRLSSTRPYYAST